MPRRHAEIAHRETALVRFATEFRTLRHAAIVRTIARMQNYFEFSDDREGWKSGRVTPW